MRVDFGQGDNKRWKKKNNKKKEPQKRNGKIMRNNKPMKCKNDGIPHFLYLDRWNFLTNTKEEEKEQKKKTNNHSTE